MEMPLEVSFLNMDHSDAVEARIREKAAKLEQFARYHPRILDDAAVRIRGAGSIGGES